MEAIRIIQKRENGHLKLDITLPAEESAEEFEVIVRPVHQEDFEAVRKKRLAALQQFKGIFKDATYQVDKYDVYDQ